MTDLYRHVSDRQGIGKSAFLPTGGGSEIVSNFLGGRSGKTDEKSKICISFD